jgi:hypothetical protein
VSKLDASGAVSVCVIAEPGCSARSPTFPSFRASVFPCFRVSVFLLFALLDMAASPRGRMSLVRSIRSTVHAIIAAYSYSVGSAKDALRVALGLILVLICLFTNVQVAVRGRPLNQRGITLCTYTQIVTF